MTLAETQGYRATEEQWARIEAFEKRDPNWEMVRALLELRSRIEALEKHWHNMDSGVLTYPFEAGPAPSQAAETTTEWEMHQHDLLRWKAQAWKVEPIAGPTRADVEWCQTCGALSVASGNFKFPKVQA